MPPRRLGAPRPRLSAWKPTLPGENGASHAYKPFTRESRKLHRSRRDCGTIPRRGEGRLVPIPPRTRVIASPAGPIRVVGLALLLLAVALLFAAKPVSAATPCWQKVVQDWYEDSRIDGLYERHCYTDALKHIPEDIRTYGSFEEDVRAALLRATRNSRSLAGTGDTPRTPPRPGSANEPPEGLFQQAFDELGPRNADSMPVPLLILGGLALLLIAAGAAGLITRRLKARRAAGP